MLMAPAKTCPLTKLAGARLYENLARSNMFQSCRKLSLVHARSDPQSPAKLCQQLERDIAIFSPSVLLYSVSDNLNQ